MDRKSEHCREVYAHFGLAIYASQCLEQAMIHLIVFLDHFPAATANYRSKDIWEEEFDDFFKTETNRTMGQLLGRLQKLGLPYEELNCQLKNALVKRNWLAHSYFSERAMEFLSEKGRNDMISELYEITEYFGSVDAGITKVFRDIAKKYGLTDEIFEKMMSEISAEAESDL